jgi:hypothetical protein
MTEQRRDQQARTVYGRMRNHIDDKVPATEIQDRHQSPHNSNRP